MKLRQTSSKFEYQNLIQKLLRSPKYFSQEYGLIAETCRLWGGARQKWFQFYCEDWEDSPKKTLKTILWLMLRKVSDWTGSRQCRPTLSMELLLRPLQFKTSNQYWFEDSSKDSSSSQMIKLSSKSLNKFDFLEKLSIL